MNRRDFLKGTAGAIAGVAGGIGALVSNANASTHKKNLNSNDLEASLYEKLERYWEFFYNPKSRNVEVKEGDIVFTYPVTVLDGGKIEVPGTGPKKAPLIVNDGEERYEFESNFRLIRYWRENKPKIHVDLLPNKLKIEVYKKARVALEKLNDHIDNVIARYINQPPISKK